MIKKLIGICVIIIIFAGNGSFLYALENNNINQNNSSKTFTDDVKQSINNLQTHAMSTGENIREGFELAYGLVEGTTIIVGPSEEYKNLKDAVEHSKSGDTLLIVQGNYTGENNTNINIDHNLTIKPIVPFKSWITYNNTNYSYEEFYKLLDTDNMDDIDNLTDKTDIDNLNDMLNNSIDHQENATILNGNDSAQIFNVSSNVNLELSGLFLVNGNSSLCGGAIYNKGNLKIDDSYFIGNEVFDNNILGHTERYGGGAIYNEGTLDLSLTNFFSNKAQDYSLGGAIYNAGKIGYINNCSFNGNYADNGGGAIYNNKTLDSLNKNLFNGNIADSETSHCGGAILDEGNNNTLNLKKVVFYSNLAKSGGGGAVDSYSSSGIKNNNSTFIFNHAETDGGAIRSLNAKILNLDNASFNYNTAEHQGGSIYYNGDSFKSFNSEYTGNVAENDGGGLYLGSCEDSSFLNNDFTMNVADNGGAIYHNGGFLNLNNNTLIFNNANQTTNMGGAIYTKNGEFNITNDTFERNYALGNGGAIYNQNSKGLINYTVFHENMCSNDGGILYNNHYNVSINNCSVYDNAAGGNGGAIYNNKEGTNFLVNQTIFANNTAVKNGGSFYNTADSTFIYFSGFGSNIAREGSGGALYNNGNNMGIELNDFQYNFAQDSGGAIFNNGKYIQFSSLNITNNAAHKYGGGYFDESNNLEAKSTIFKDNSAGDSGDDYYTQGDKDAKVIGCLVGLAVAMIVITVISVVVPAATGLYGAIGAAAAAAGWSVGGSQLAIFGAQAIVAVAAGLIFMGIEEAVNAACPEFEDWNSKYWYVALIIFVVCAASSAIITNAITNSVFQASSRILGYMSGTAGTYQIFQMTSDFAATIYGALGTAGGFGTKILAGIAIVLSFSFAIFHLDDWLINGIIALVNNANKAK
jgi:predicted outer membrane repeat protein